MGQSIAISEECPAVDVDVGPIGGVSFEDCSSSVNSASSLFTSVSRVDASVVASSIDPPAIVVGN